MLSELGLSEVHSGRKASNSEISSEILNLENALRPELAKLYYQAET